MLLLLEARDLASSTVARLKHNLEGLSGRQKLLAGGFAAAAAGGTAAAYELARFADGSVKAAAQFQQSTTLLTTQAGVARSRIAGLADAMLQMAPRFGQSAQTLADALYHVASAGVPVRQQLATLKAAAMGAAIGNTSLEDTTNSLVAALRSGVGGISGARNAMATILAIVGTGNMRLQEFNAAMGTGLPGAANTFGVSLQSAGAALAYLTDTGMGAQTAATRLTMAMALMGGPTQQSAKVLHALGLAGTAITSRFAVVSQMLAKAGVTQSQLAADMRKPDGLVVALTDLKARMTQAGISAQGQAAIISRAFGGGHMGKAIMQLSQSLGLVRTKFDAINSGVAGFGAKWRQTTETAAFQAKQLHAGMNSVSTAVGEALLPAVQKLAAALVPLITHIAEWTTKHKTLAAIILGSAFAASVLAAAVGALGLAFLVAGTQGLILAGVVAGIFVLIPLLAAAAYELYKNWATIWPEMQKLAREVWDDLRGYFWTVTNRIISDAQLLWLDFKGWLGTLWSDIEQLAITVFDDVKTALSHVWDGVLNDVITAWNAVIDWFKGLPDRILGALENAGEWLLGLGGDIISGLWDGIKAGAQIIWDFFASVAGKVSSAFVGAARWLYGEGQNVIGGLWQGIKDAWDGIAAWFSQTGNRVGGAFAGAARWLYGEGSNILGGLWGGIRDAWSGIAGWFGNLSARIGGYFDGAAGWLLKEGDNIITGLLNGIEKTWKTVSKWLSRVDTMVGQWFKGAGRWLYDAGVSIIEGVWNGMKNKWHDVEGWLGSLAGKIKNLKGPLPQDLVLLQPEGQAIIQGLAVGMKQAAGADLTSTLQAITRGISQTVTGSIGPTPLGGGSPAPAQVVFDFRGSQIMSDADINALAQRVGRQLATTTLPMSGMQVKRS